MANSSELGSSELGSSELGSSELGSSELGSSELRNLTRGCCVKFDNMIIPITEQCNCYQVMHQFHWYHTDRIVSSHKGSTYLFLYSRHPRTMRGYNTSAVCTFSSTKPVYNFTTDDYRIVQADPIVYAPGLNHVPVWDGNTCKTCGYISEH